MVPVRMAWAISANCASLTMSIDCPSPDRPNPEIGACRVTMSEADLIFMLVAVLKITWLVRPSSTVKCLPNWPITSLNFTGLASTSRLSILARMARTTVRWRSARSRSPFGRPWRWRT